LFNQGGGRPVLKPFRGGGARIKRLLVSISRSSAAAVCRFKEVPLVEGGFGHETSGGRGGRRKKEGITGVIPKRAIIEWFVRQRALSEGKRKIIDASR